MAKEMDTAESIPGEDWKPDSTKPIDPELIANVKQAMAVPAPNKDIFWELIPLDPEKKRKKSVFKMLRRQAPREEIYQELKKAVEQAPGNTRVRIKKLRKKYPYDGALLMYSAMSTFGMVLNSCNQEIAFGGFRNAAKEAANALLWDQISLANVEAFFKIYFAYLDRFKRFQVVIYEQMLKEPRLEDNKRDFLNAIQIAEQLYSDREGIQKVLNNLKQRMKSSMYAKNIEFSLIREAAHHIVKENRMEKTKLGTAGETIAYIHAMASAFARIPILSPVVDKILAEMPEAQKTFLLRKISINSTRNFVKYRMAAAEGDKEQMAKLGKTILRENTFGTAKLEGHSLNQPYETDPFFNLAYLAELSHGLYTDSEHQEIVETAMEAMNTVISHDMSKNHIFTDMATRLSHKLGILRSANASQEEGKKEAPSEET